MPIDIATGDVELAREDFSLPGRVPVVWTRHYRTSLIGASYSLLGPGWTASWLPALRRTQDGWHFRSPEGQVHTFADLDSTVEDGSVIRLLGAYAELVREDDDFVVTRWDPETPEVRRYVFGRHPTTRGTTLLRVRNISGDDVDVVGDENGRFSALRQRIEGRQIVVNYARSGRINSLDLETKQRGRTELVRYEYDSAGRLCAAIGRAGLANRYEYDAQSRVTREVLADGDVYSYKYDTSGRCMHFSGLDRYNEKHLRFMDAARTTIVTNSYGKSSIYEHLPSGQIVSECDTAGNRRRTCFDEYGRVFAEIDPTGATTRFGYDENGNRDSITDPLGNTYRFVFNARHQALSMTNPLGKTWHYEYDAQHRLVATRDPLNARWTAAYDEAGNMARITDPLGSSRRQRFEDGLLREATDWMNHVTQYKWDECGRLTERIGPGGERTAYRYDVVGNLVEVEQADGTRLRASYDSGGNLSAFTNAKGHTTHFRYGPCHRLLERVDPLGRAVRYVWGSEPGRLDGLVNERGERLTYVRDDQARVIRERSFDGRERGFEFDAAGRCVSIANGNGETIRLTRDVAGRLMAKSLPDGNTTSFEYDLLGRIVSAENVDTRVRCEYDAAGRLIREVQGEHWVQNAYNAAGEVVRTTTSLGHDIRYDLDPNGRVRMLSTANGQSVAFERDPRGLEVARQMPGGVRLVQHYDSMGRLAWQRAGHRHDPVEALSGNSQVDAAHDIVARDYRYGADGRMLSIADRRWGATDYTYDPAGRLLSAVRELGLSEEFEYDLTGNLTRARRDSPRAEDRTCVYAPGDRLIACDGVRFEFDPDGRLVRKTETDAQGELRVWEYSWNAEGDLRKIRRPDGEEWSYKYDPFGRRVSKTGPASGCDFLWDGDVIIQELPHRGDPVSWITKRGSFAPVARVQDATIYPIITDHLGTPREMLDASGNVVWAASFTAWGQTERKLNTTAGPACPIRFQGQWSDDESGLLYNRFRYCDSNTARFISSDPIGLAGGSNLYSYVRDPVGWIDPFGLGKSKCKDDEQLPELDATGKVHGELPKREDLGKLSREELVQLQAELRQSVERRIEVTTALGPDRAHGQRQAAEQQLITAIDKVLSES